MVNPKLTKVKPGHICSFWRKQFQTNDMGNEHTVQSLRKRTEKLKFECAECDYAAKRARDLKRHVQTRHKADSREKTELGEMDNKGKGPRNPHEFIGLVYLSRKPIVTGEKEKSADDFSAVEPLRKVSHFKQGDAPETSKSKSKLKAGSRRKLSSADKHHRGKPKKMVSTCTQTHRCCGQAGSPEVQTKGPDNCKRGIQVSPVEKLTGLSATKRQQSEDEG
jgi:hypothetical protein